MRNRFCQTAYCNTLVFSLFFILALFGNNAAFGQNPKDITLIVNYRIDGENCKMEIPCSYYIDADGNNLTTSKHNLPDNPRYLAHVAPGTLGYPTITQRNGTIRIFSTELVDAFWEYNHYGSGYTRVSSADPSQNCHGYSTGKGVWLDDFMKLVTDDWKEYTLVDDLPSGGGAVYGDDNHSAKIESVTWSGENDSKYTVSISEKWRDSGVYKSSYTKTIDLSEIAELDLKTQRKIITFRKFYKQN